MRMFYAPCVSKYVAFQDTKLFSMTTQPFQKKAALFSRHVAAEVGAGVSLRLARGTGFFKATVLRICAFLPNRAYGHHAR